MSPVAVVPPKAEVLDEVLPVAIPADGPGVVPPVSRGTVMPEVGRPGLPGEGVGRAAVDGGGWPGSALTMMSPNCSVVVSRPRASIGSSNGCVRVDGCWPSIPAGASRFWLRMASATSRTVMFSDASFCGSSQARML